MKNNWGLNEGQQQVIYIGSERPVVVDNAGAGTISLSYKRMGGDNPRPAKKIYPGNIVAVEAEEVSLKGDPDGSSGAWWFQDRPVRND